MNHHEDQAPWLCGLTEFINKSQIGGKSILPNQSMTPGNVRRQIQSNLGGITGNGRLTLKLGLKSKSSTMGFNDVIQSVKAGIEHSPVPSHHPTLPPHLISWPHLHLCSLFCHPQLKPAAVTGPWEKRNSEGWTATRSTQFGKWGYFLLELSQSRAWNKYSRTGSLFGRAFQRAGVREWGVWGTDIEKVNTSMNCWRTVLPEFPRKHAEDFPKMSILKMGGRSWLPSFIGWGLPLYVLTFLKFPAGHVVSWPHKCLGAESKGVVLTHGETGESKLTQSFPPQSALELEVWPVGCVTGHQTYVLQDVSLPKGKRTKRYHTITGEPKTKGTWTKVLRK